MEEKEREMSGRRKKGGTGGGTREEGEVWAPPRRHKRFKGKRNKVAGGKD